MNRLFSFVRLDFITVKPYLTLKYMFILIAVTLLMNAVSISGTGAMGVVMVFGAVFAGYPFAVGEKSGMDVLYATLSIKRGTVVLGRYLFALTLDLCAGLFEFFIYFVLLTASRKGFDAAQTLATIGALFLLFSVVQAIQLPMYFKLGYTKAKFVTYLPFILLPVIVVMFSNFLRYDVFSFERFYGVVEWFAGHILVTAAAGGVIWLTVMAVSYRVSVSVYGRRDF